MDEKIDIIYHKEYWYLSAFLNSEKMVIEKKIEEIESIIKKRISILKRSDLKQISWNPEYQDIVMEMGKNISIKCKWISHIPRFKYYDENLHRDFTELGSFQFEVEYFKYDLKKKEIIKPILIQQIPILVLETLKDYTNTISENDESNEYLSIDQESQIYVFVISTETKPAGISWTRKKILDYKKSLGFWTEIYSGSWDDYSDALFEDRCENNLSNRLSELHFLRRNSGFIYMAEDNYNKFFESYMIENVLIPTAKIRAISFALLSVEDSLEAFSHQERKENFKLLDQKFLDKKIEKLRELRRFREMIQEQMSLIFDEQVLNRRQHYTSVLNHLIQDFRIEKTYDRITKKFEMISTLMENISLEHQKRMKSSMERLNILIVASVIAEIVGFFIGAYKEVADMPLFILNLSSLLLMIIILVYVVFRIFFPKSEPKKKEKKKAVLAIIPYEGYNKVVVTRRKNGPFKGLYSLPGCLIDKRTDSQEAIKREVEEETGFPIKISEKLAETIYDPLRPDIKTTTFICSLTSELEPDMKKKLEEKGLEGRGNALKVEIKPINKLTYNILAFDHREILDKFKDKFIKEF